MNRVRKLNDPSDTAEHPLVNPEMNNGAQRIVHASYASYVHVDLLTRAWEKSCLNSVTPARQFGNTEREMIRQKEDTHWKLRALSVQEEKIRCCGGGIIDQLTILLRCSAAKRGAGHF